MKSEDDEMASTVLAYASKHDGEPRWLCILSRVAVGSGLVAVLVPLFYRIVLMIVGLFGLVLLIAGIVVHRNRWAILYGCTAIFAAVTAFYLSMEIGFVLVGL